MTGLGDHVLRCAGRIFPAGELPEAVRLLEDCGGSERLQCAVLKISGGTIAGLARAVAESRIDYRDVLMAAGFGADVEAHRRWHGDIRRPPPSSRSP